MLDPRERRKQEAEVAEWRAFRERYGAAWLSGKRPFGGIERYWGLTVVDLGSGPRKGIEYLPAAVRIKLDCCMAAYRREGLIPAPRPGEECLLVQAMGEALPLADASVHCIICLNTLDHCFDPGHVVAECRRVLVLHGELHVHVDVGGTPTLCEPTVFTEERLHALFHGFELLHGQEEPPAHPGRKGSVRLVLRKP